MGQVRPCLHPLGRSLLSLFRPKAEPGSSIPRPDTTTNPPPGCPSASRIKCAHFHSPIGALKLPKVTILNLQS